MNDPKHISGIGNLIPVTDPALAPEIIKLEQDIVRGANIRCDNDSSDAAREFKDEMARLSTNFMTGYNSNIQENDGENNMGGSSDLSFHGEDPESNHHQDGDQDDQFANLKSDSYSPQPTCAWNSTFVAKDPKLQRATLEEQKQRHINSVLNDVEDEELGIDVDKDREEDEKANLLEQIDMLRDTLDDDGINITSVPIVSKNNSLTDIRNVHKMLRLKNDRNRYCSFAEEMILAGAYGAEYLFDGDKEWFGRKPDLIGWPETVKVKLRRMRYDTSTFVQEIMSAYSFSPGMRLLIELIPSMLLYSRKRKTTQHDTLVNDMTAPSKKRTENDGQYRDAIANLNSLK